MPHRTGWWIHGALFTELIVSGQIWGHPRRVPRPAPFQMPGPDMAQPPGEPRPEYPGQAPFTTNSSVELRPRLLSHGDNTENKSVVSAPWTCCIPGQRFSIRAMVAPMDTGYVRACFCLFQFRVGELLAFGSQGLGCSSTFYNAQDGPTIKNDQPQVSAVPGERALL